MLRQNTEEKKKQNTIVFSLLTPRLRKIAVPWKLQMRQCGDIA